MLNFNSKRIGKVQKLGQFSLAIPLKGELLDIGLDHGDWVIITVTKDRKQIILEKVDR